MSTAPPAPAQTGHPRSGAFILTNLAAGHGITHWYMTSMMFLLPRIQESLGMSNMQFAALHVIRQLAAGAATLPAGLVIDMAKNQWGLILVACMVVEAVAYGLIAVSPGFIFLAVVIVVLPLPGTVWHMPAIAAISQRFPDKRGFGLAIHGLGSQVGSSLGPVATGALVAVVSAWTAMAAWRSVTIIYVLPALFMAVVVWWSLRDLGTSGTTPNEPSPLASRVRGIGKLMRNRAILGLVLAFVLRSIGFSSLSIWVPKYLQDSVEDGGLGMSAALAGLNVSLLTALGVLSSPVLGYLSDRYGRKVVLLPCIAASAFLTLAIGQAGGGLLLTLTILAVGMFTYSLGQVMQATVLDQVGRGTEGATMGTVMSMTHVVSGLSPLLAAAIVDSYGLVSVFYYNAAMWGTTVVVLALTPLRPPPRLAPPAPAPAARSA